MPCCSDIEDAKLFLAGLCDIARDPGTLELVEQQGLYKGDPSNATKEMFARATALLEKADQAPDVDVFLKEVNLFNAWIYGSVGGGIGM